MRSYLLILCTALILGGCTSPQKPAVTSDTVKPGQTVIRRPLASGRTSAVFKGLYTYGNEVNTFRDCNGRVYWVNDSLANVSSAYGKTNRFPPYPYESVYAEVKGYLIGPSALGYASEYESVLVVTELIKMEAKSFRTACYNYEFIALGNEPFWSLEIIPEEERIVLKDAGESKVYEFIYSKPVISKQTYRYEARTPSDEKLVAIITQKNCSDGMSDRQYTYSADVSFNGRIYRGCAIKKGQEFPNEQNE